MGNSITAEEIHVKADMICKEIEKQYGKDAVKDIERKFNPEEEVEYQKQLKLLYEKLNKKNEAMNTKIQEKRICPKCHTFSFNTRDDIYMMKYDCCEKCYILHVEGKT